MMAFPPRQDCGVFSACKPKQGADRGTSKESVLVLTEDGFWGVLDRTLSAFLLDEQDLIPMVVAEQQAPGAKFGMLREQIINVHVSPDAATKPTHLDRGQVLRIVPEGTVAGCGGDGTTCIDFAADGPSFVMARNRLMAVAGGSQRKLLDGFEVSEDKIVEIKVSGQIVPESALPAWLKRSGGYEEILKGGGFKSVYVPHSSPVQFGCNTVLLKETALSGDLTAQLKLTAKGSVGVAANTASAEALVEAIGKVTSSAKESQTTKSVILQEVSMVEVRDNDGELATFWAGRARTCGGAEATLWSVMVTIVPPNLEANAYFLHANFQEVAAPIGQATSAGVVKDAAAASIAALNKENEEINRSTFGGSPFNPTLGVMNFKCLSQAIAFDVVAKRLLSQASVTQTRVAVALASDRQQRDATKLRDFYGDKACGVK
jgi:hypothetical protein